MLGSTIGAAAPPPAFSAWYAGQSSCTFPLSSMRTARHFSKFCPRTPSMLTPFRKMDAASSRVVILAERRCKRPPGQDSPALQPLAGSGVGQARIRAVRVDGLQALGLHLPASEVPVAAQPGAHFPDQVL